MPLPVRRLLVALVPIVASGVWLWLKVSYPAEYARLVDEDGVVENLQVAGYLCMAVAFLWLTRGGSDHARPAAWRWGAAAVLCLWLVGEELSWGQRLLGFDTPGWWRERNLQYETNLHNLRIFRPWVNKTPHALALAGSGAWLLASWSALARRIAPPWYLSTFFWPAVAFYVVWGAGAHFDLGPLARGALVVVEDQEVAELWILTGIAATVLVHAGSNPPAAPAGAEHLRDREVRRFSRRSARHVPTGCGKRVGG